MTHTPLKLTFEQYLEYNDHTDNRYELFDGELIKMPPESGENTCIALGLMYKLAKFINFLPTQKKVYYLRVPHGSNSHPQLNLFFETGGYEEKKFACTTV
ncbi:MAG: hypothetical protein F6K41_44210 [Symploca sp. SIO3E6]|nr:hypothetical protein [Caldora sp. SIO3E6]